MRASGRYQNHLSFLSFDYLLDILGRYFYFHFRALGLQPQEGPRIERPPAARHRFRHLGMGEAVETHRHADLARELGGERHVLESEGEREIGRLELALKELVGHALEGTLAS